MALTRTEAVILKSTDYSETSRIYRLYTFSYGIQSLIAKGVKRPGHKTPGVLEIMNHVEVVYYKKRNRNLYTLSQATPIETFSGLSSDIHRFYRASAITELILRLSAEEEANEALFHLLVRSLRSFSKRPIATLAERMFSFIWGILSLLGYAPQLESCVSCGVSADAEASAIFSVKEGGIVCDRCEAAGPDETYRLPSRVKQVMSPHDVGNIVGLSAEEEDLLMRLTENYINFHLQDRRSLVCWKFLRTLKV
jgi:DNA repair protein RecO (recombination protein O)